MVELPKCRCGNPDCKHIWTPRVPNPVKCPICGTPLPKEDDKRGT